MTTSFAGTGLLLRLALRRDRVLIPVWLAVLVLVSYASAAATPGLYPSAAERVRAAEAINASPGIVALYGPILDVHSTGELAMTKMTVLYAVFVALMMLFVVRRHTRVDEEGGQAELLGGTALTRRSPLGAAVLLGCGAAVLLGVLAAAANVAGGLPTTGSLAFGASWAGTGLVATGVTALACELSPSARTCAGIAAAAIGGLFLLRAVGDTAAGVGWLSWLTPFGWGTRLRAYSGTRWWVLVLYVAAAAVLVAAALALRSRRDLGAGVVPQRPGPPTGSPRLADVVALSLRVHTPMLAGWTAAVATISLLFGLITPSFDAFGSPAIREMLSRLGGEGGFREIMLAAVLSMVALVVTCFAVAVVAHSGSDEHDGRTEQVLAAATSRSRAFVATLVTAVLGATWLLLVAGVAMALGVGNDVPSSFSRLVGSALAQGPAVWTVAALAVLCFALRSSLTHVGWAIVVLAATLGQVGELLGLPDWVSDLSPYSHAPRMPVEDFAPIPALVLSAISVAALAVAWWSYRRRDIG